MQALFHTDGRYQNRISSYSRTDGIKAIGLFIFEFLSCYVLGLLMLSNLSVSVLNAANYVFYLIQLIPCLLLVLVSGQTAASIGLHRNNLGKSLLFGLIGTAVFSLCVIALHLIFGETQLELQQLPIFIVLSFAFFAIQEEILYRGYIQTRITALISNPALSTAVTAVLFLLIHYPVKWAVSGSFSFTILSPFYVICLLLLHIFCDWVYRTTDCLYGSILLHFLYNVFSAMLLAS